MFDHLLEQLRAALLEQIRCPDEPIDLVPAALAALAQGLRENGVMAERMVILVKQQWDAAMYEYSNPEAKFYQHLRQSVVTSAIKAYYLL